MNKLKFKIILTKNPRKLALLLRYHPFHFFVPLNSLTPPPESATDLDFIIIADFLFTLPLSSSTIAHSEIRILFCSSLPIALRWLEHRQKPPRRPTPAQTGGMLGRCAAMIRFPLGGVVARSRPEKQNGEGPESLQSDVGVAVEEVMNAIELDLRIYPTVVREEGEEERFCDWRRRTVDLGGFFLFIFFWENCFKFGPIMPNFKN